MGKEKRLVSATLSSFMNEFRVFTNDDKVLYCIAYKVKVNVNKRFWITQHLNTTKVKPFLSYFSNVELNHRLAAETYDSISVLQ